MNRNKFARKGHTVLKNNDEVFALRRRVIDALYEARRVVDRYVPRVDVRVVEYSSDRTLGQCWIGENFITVTYDLAKADDRTLTHVVWHELAHAWFNAPHVETCPLMAPVVGKASKRELAKALKSLANKTA